MKPVFTSLFVWLASITFATMAVAAPKTIPTLSYLDGTGEIYTLDASKNKLTAIHFWATWCAPCIEELPEVNKAQQTYGSKGLSIVAISMDNNLEVVWDFFRQNKINLLRAYIDNGAASFNGFKIKGLPTTIFVNTKGEEVARVEGPMHWEDETNRAFFEEQLK